MTKIIKSVKIDKAILEKYEAKAKKLKRSVHWLMVESLEKGAKRL